MEACESCGAALSAAGPCARCGHPAVSAAAAKALAEASDLVAVGQYDIALRRTQAAVKEAPESWLPRLRLAQLYGRKAVDGEPALQRLADREMGEAMRLGPLEKEVHFVRIASLAKGGGFTALRADYEGRKGVLPAAEECLKMIDALESAAAFARGQANPVDNLNIRARMFLMTSVITGVGTLGILVEIMWQIRNRPEYEMMASVDFYLCSGLLTATGILALEFLRAKGIIKK